jgi:hypothetical protein
LFNLFASRRDVSVHKLALSKEHLAPLSNNSSFNLFASRRDVSAPKLALSKEHLAPLSDNSSFNLFASRRVLAHELKEPLSKILLFNLFLSKLDALKLRSLFALK